jgi:hypothetical protein
MKVKAYTGIRGLVVLACAIAMVAMTVASSASAARKNLEAPLWDGSSPTAVGEAYFGETVFGSRLQVTLNPQYMAIKPDPRATAAPPRVLIGAIVAGEMRLTVDGRWVLEIVDNLNQFPTVKPGLHLRIQQGPTILAKGKFATVS